jgi:hypothetical protein
MKFFQKAKDGGPKSTVTGFWIIELKSLFSIVLLKFDKGSREVYHSHAFNALTWWLKGKVDEHLINGIIKTWTPSLKPKITLRGRIHKVYGKEVTYALSIRGPWHKTWLEYDNKGNSTTLTHGRKIV